MQNSEQNTIIRAGFANDVKAYHVQVLVRCPANIVVCSDETKDFAQRCLVLVHLLVPNVGGIKLDLSRHNDAIEPIPRSKQHWLRIKYPFQQQA